LAKRVPAEEVIRQIAAFRAHDKHNPEDYARRTVSKARTQLTHDTKEGDLSRDN
jgi:hypothetical protein